MADKRKQGSDQAKRHPVVKRPRRAPAGRIAVRRDTAAYRSAATDPHSMQVREQIDAALAEAQRIREEIEHRIELRLQEERQGERPARVGQAVAPLAAKSPLRTVKPLEAELGKGDLGKKGQTLTSRPKLSR